MAHVMACSDLPLESCNYILRSPTSPRHDGIREMSFRQVGRRRPPGRSRYKGLELDDKQSSRGTRAARTLIYFRRTVDRTNLPRYSIELPRIIASLLPLTMNATRCFG